MEQIVIYQKRPSGSTYVTNELELFSQSPFRWVTACSWKGSLMSDDYVQMTVVSMEYMSFCVGDYCIINGKKYSIRSMADVVRKGEDQYEYTIIMYGVMYDLIKRQFRNTDMNGNSSHSTFDLTYDLQGFMNVIIYNMNREVADTDKEWRIGNATWPTTDYLTISFAKNNCLTALQSICSDQYFDTEFRIEREYDSENDKYWNTIYIGDGNTTPVNSTPFAWGKGNGLYQLKECKIDDSTLINRLWAEGGTENVKSSYRNYAQRLQLPFRRLNEYAHTLKDGTSVPVHAEYIGIIDENKRYIEDTDLKNRYGVIEDTWQSDEYYPNFTGTICKLKEDNQRLRFYAYLGFNLNDKWAKQDTTGFATDYAEWCYINGYYRDLLADYMRYCSLNSLTDEYHEYLDDHGYTEDDLTFAGWEELIMQGLITPTPATYTAFEMQVSNALSAYNSVANANSTKYLVDSSTPAKVTFLDGKLAGCEFDIEDNFEQHMLQVEGRLIMCGLLTIKPFTDETETVFPSEDSTPGQPFRFAVGDKFKLTNIFLPYSYYVKAEEDLWYAAKEQFDEVKQPSYKYELTFDEAFVMENENIFQSMKVGSYIKVMDDRFFSSLTNYTISMRITAIEFDMLKEYSYKLTLENVHKLKKNPLGNNMVRMYHDYNVLVEVTRDWNDPQFRRRNSGQSTSGLRGQVLTADKKLRVDLIDAQSISEGKLVSEVVEKLTKAVNTYDEVVTARGESASLSVKIGLKADQSTTYTKEQVDNVLSQKANLSTTYTKAEVDTAVSQKADANQFEPYVKELDPNEEDVQQWFATGVAEIDKNTHGKGDYPRVLITLYDEDKEFLDYDIKYKSTKLVIVFNPAIAVELEYAKIQIMK